MVSLLLLIVYSATFSQKDSTGYSVAIELIQSASAKELKLKVQVKNLTGQPVSVFKRRYEDYKREKIKAVGNYVIEIEKWQSDSYKLFTPTADIDPYYLGEDIVTVQNGSSITDTLNISGFDFSRSDESKRGFPAGNYRIRVYFNPYIWTTSERNGSNWIEFAIE